MERLLELFEFTPGYRLLHITDDAAKAATPFLNPLKECEGQLDIIQYGQREHFFPEHVKLRTVASVQKPFKAAARDYESMLVVDMLHQTPHPHKFLKHCYTCLENSALILVLQKKGTMETERIKELLDSVDFQAANGIDIIEGYELVVAKKMHMWCNGL